MTLLKLFMIFIVRLNCSILCSAIITRLFLLLIEPAVNVQVTLHSLYVLRPGSLCLAATSEGQ